MTRFELERQLTCKTGESLSTIRRRGFSLVRLHPASVADNDDQGPLIIDWEQRQAGRLHAVVEVDCEA